MKSFLMNTGQFENKVIRTVRAKMSKQQIGKVKPLPEDKAMGRGAELISEVLVYGSLVGYGLYEIYAVQKNDRRKIKNQKSIVKEMFDSLYAVDCELSDLKEASKREFNDIRFSYYNRMCDKLERVLSLPSPSQTT
jgi:hypothetical protein